MYIRLKDTENDNMEILKDKVRAFAAANGVAENKVFYSSTYFSLGEDLPIEKKYWQSCFCCVLIVIATSLVIYSLFLYLRHCQKHRNTAGSGLSERRRSRSEGW